MSLFVLDTDIVSLLQRGHPRVVSRCAARRPEELAISVISLEEQLSGWYSLLRKTKQPDELVKAYQSLIDSLLFLARLPILPLTLPAIARFGDWQEINYLDHARGDTNPTRQRGDRRRQVLASASVPCWRVGLVWPVFSVPVSMRSLETDRSLGDFRAAGRLSTLDGVEVERRPDGSPDCCNRAREPGSSDHAQRPRLRPRPRSRAGGLDPMNARKANLSPHKRRAERWRERRRSTD